jgi:hypothetical protein
MYEQYFELEAEFYLLLASEFDREDDSCPEDYMFSATNPLYD